MANKHSDQTESKYKITEGCIDLSVWKLDICLTIGFQNSIERLRLRIITLNLKRDTHDLEARAPNEVSEDLNSSPSSILYLGEDT